MNALLTDLYELTMAAGYFEARKTAERAVFELMQRDALQALAMANKAGAVVTGSTKVEAAIASGTIAVLVHASDGRPDGIRKLDAQLRQRHGEGADDIPKINLFHAEQLDLALGRTNVIHAALAGGGTCDAFLARCRRIASYRSGAIVDASAGNSADAWSHLIRNCHSTGLICIASLFKFRSCHHHLSVEECRGRARAGYPAGT